MTAGPAKVGDTFRYYFALRLGSGAPRTGASGSVTATVRNPGDSATSSPTVTESAIAGGLYYIDIPGSFTTTHGAGEYAILLEVTSPPRDTFAETIAFFVNDLDDLSTHSAADVDALLGANHGSGQWDLTAAEVDAELSLNHGSGVWEGTTPAAIDALLSLNHGSGSWEGTTPAAIDALLSLNHGSGLWALSAADVDTLLSANHGTGSWEGYTPAEIEAFFAAIHGSGLWEGTTPAAIDALLSLNHGSGLWDLTASQVDIVLSAAHGTGLWEGTTPSDIDSLLSSVHGSGLWEGTTPADIDALLSAIHGTGIWETFPGGFPTVDEISDGVWDEALSGHTTAGTSGDTLGDIPATLQAILDCLAILKRFTTNRVTLSELLVGKQPELVQNPTRKPGEEPPLGGGIDMRKAMDEILGAHGHKVFLRRKLEQRPPNWREDRREVVPEEDPYNWEGSMYQDELHLTYRRPALGLVAEGIVDTLRTPVGELTARQTIFYFKHDVAPKVGDGIIYVTLNADGDPIRPYEMERMWKIEMVEDFRDKRGRIEYWGVMAEQRAIGK